jgi:protease PrsW
VTVAPVAVSLLPIPAFLALLRLLDSYKLMSLRRTAQNILVGCAVAALCYGVNTAAFSALGGNDLWYVRVGAPVVEEVLKAAWLIWLIRSNRIGFMVDAAISGFAIGAGFALVENLTYLLQLQGEVSPLVWLLRGFGTAMLHGGCTAIAGILASSLAERRGAGRWSIYLPGLALAIAIHIAYNAAVLSPIASAAAILVGLPVLLGIVFLQSEASLRKWLGEGLDKDVDLLLKISGGGLSETHAGRYLKALKTSLPPEIVGDMLCVLQISLELGAKAKGDLLLREMDFEVPPDPTVPARLKELQYLEKSIGTAGRRAMAPLLSRSTRDLWQLHMLREE